MLWHQSGPWGQQVSFSVLLEQSREGRVSCVSQAEGTADSQPFGGQHGLRDVRVIRKALWLRAVKRRSTVGEGSGLAGAVLFKGLPCSGLCVLLLLKASVSLALCQASSSGYFGNRPE